MLAEGHLLAGQIEVARAAAEEALTFSRRRKEHGFEAWARRVLAEITAGSELPDAERKGYYRTALALASRLEMSPLVAHCHLGLGKLYRRTDKREQAEEHLATATTMYREMGMTYWLEKAEAEMQERG
jgi:hypothetical protein